MQLCGWSKAASRSGAATAADALVMAIARKKRTRLYRKNRHTLKRGKKTLNRSKRNTQNASVYVLACI